MSFLIHCDNCGATAGVEPPSPAEPGFRAPKGWKTLAVYLDGSVQTAHICPAAHGREKREAQAPEALLP